MTSEQLAQVEERARLYADEGDREALRPEDVSAMLAEIREARLALTHLIATTRRHHIGAVMEAVIP
jgi:nicotinamide mononucleotide adenylyltransferase